MKKPTYRISIEGTVQGVGFRPFIYQLANRFNLFGTVSNGTQGVEILLTCRKNTLEMFLQTIQAELPSLASIDKIITNKINSIDFTEFNIISTDNEGKVTVQIPPDVSTCEECERELFDPQNRRYQYPFITCTHCGVRYSIITDLPYDRKNTSMHFFEMCKSCKEEYTNPLDRRYHAQPIGCWDCGPSLSLANRKGKVFSISNENLIEKCVELLLEGNILAIKGVGGYHLVCDATNDTAVYKMRERKKRPSKPYAVMVADIQCAHTLACIDAKEEELLTSKERPIVLLDVKNRQYSQYVAPNMSRIGLFLPYTPLHLLLLKKLNRPLVATSANVTDEPICINIESLKKLQGVYDYVLDHNREIVNGCDDSVVMVVNNQRVILRRARGYAPVSIKLPFKLKNNVMALGANQKSTIAIGFNKEAILSPHIGDLNTIDSVQYFEQSIDTLQRMYHFTADVVMHDKHPYYESTKYALEHYATTYSVQHHYAHILGVMVEKKLTGKVLGVAFDGTGYGDDGKLWGGEFLVCDYEGFERVMHIDYFKLLGGAKAIREPKRVALSLLFELHGEDALRLDNPTIKAFSSLELKTYYIAWKKGLNAPLCSSVGRLFDAVSSLVGVCQIMSFEGESGMILEELYDANVQGSYTFTFENGKINILTIIKEILLEDEVRIAVSKFFHTLVEIIYHMHQQYSLPLVLSGGVFQNSVLLSLILEKIPNAIIANNIPPNDGGIALGQIAYNIKE